MTAREIKNHAEVSPPRKEIYSVASILGLLQLIGFIMLAIVPNRDAIRDNTESIRLMKEHQLVQDARLEAFMETEARKWDAMYQKDLREAVANAEMRAAVKRIDSYFDSQQRRQ